MEASLRGLARPARALCGSPGNVPHEPQCSAPSSQHRTHFLGFSLGLVRLRLLRPATSHLRLGLLCQRLGACAPAPRGFYARISRPVHQRSQAFDAHTLGTYTPILWGLTRVHSRDLHAHTLGTCMPALGGLARLHFGDLYAQYFGDLYACTLRTCMPALGGLACPVLWGPACPHLEPCYACTRGNCMPTL